MKTLARKIFYQMLGVKHCPNCGSKKLYPINLYRGTYPDCATKITGNFYQCNRCKSILSDYGGNELHYASV